MRVITTRLLNLTLTTFILNSWTSVLLPTLRPQGTLTINQPLGRTHNEPSLGGQSGLTHNEQDQPGSSRADGVPQNSSQHGSLRREFPPESFSVVSSSEVADLKARLWPSRDCGPVVPDLVKKRMRDGHGASEAAMVLAVF